MDDLQKRSWAEISRANIASSRILKGSKEKKLAEIDRTERLYREKYERDYSMKSSKSAEDISRNGNNAVPEKGYGRVKTAATTGFSGREGLSDLYTRISKKTLNAPMIVYKKCSTVNPS